MIRAEKRHVLTSLVLALFIVAMFAVAPPPKDAGEAWLADTYQAAKALTYDDMACISLFFSNASHSLDLMMRAFSRMPELLLFLFEPIAAFPARLPRKTTRLRALPLRILDCHPHQAPPVTE